MPSARDGDVYLIGSTLDVHCFIPVRVPNRPHYSGCGGGGAKLGPGNESRHGIFAFMVREGVTRRISWLRETCIRVGVDGRGAEARACASIRCEKLSARMRMVREW